MDLEELFRLVNMGLLSIRAAAKKAGIPKSTFYDRYRKWLYGLSGTSRSRRAPHTKSADREIRDLAQRLWFVEENIEYLEDQLYPLWDIGLWKARNCAYQVGGYCTFWHWSKPGRSYEVGDFIKVHVRGKDLWRLRVISYKTLCAVCHKFKFKGKAEDEGLIEVEE